jgi:glycosyltransferase involved in cell wall biosynthesis
MQPPDDTRWSAARSRTRSVVWLQPVFPAYTQPLIDELSSRLGPDVFRVVGGARYFDETVSTDLRPDTRYTQIRNRYVLGRRLLWQSSARREAGRSDVLLTELNPRILTVWWLLIARRITGRRTVLYGHAYPRRGHDSRTDRLRGLLRRLADAVIVYTQSEADRLRSGGAQHEIHAAPNAFLRRAEIAPAQAESTPRDFLYVGRLVREKKPALLVEAFREALPNLPPEVRLVIVGDGPGRDELEAVAADEPRIRFLGEIRERDRLRERYGTAIASVSPGPAGLSLIQSISFGVPMILARDEPHGPEIEAARDGENVVLVGSHRRAAFADALVQTAAARDEWLARRPGIADWCAERYSVDVMADRVLAAIEAPR